MAGETITGSGSSGPGPTIEEFEAHAFAIDSFDHEAHVYVAWLYLQRYDLLTSIDRFRTTLIRLTENLGMPGKYHETITWFYMIVVAESLVGNSKSGWECFKRQNPALFRRNPSVIRDFYSEERLMSDAARATFLLPDLAAVA